MEGMPWRQSIGRRGEDIAAEYLAKKGYTIRVRNFRTRYGEIDLVCRKGSEVIFVEVKTRASDQFGLPEEAVTSQKLRHLRRAAAIFRSRFKIWDPCRIDVITVGFQETDGRILQHLEGVILE